MIFPNIYDLSSHLSEKRKENPELRVVLTCGGFDPVHIGHLRCFQDSVRIKDSMPEDCIFVIVANADGFLINKKGKVFMPENERLEILHGFKGVDYVTSWYDGTQNCIGALEILRPNIFTKGGDRTSRENIPESEVCDKIGCDIVLGVGGGKIQSSSWLTGESQN